MAIRVVNQKHIRNRKPEGTLEYVGRSHPEFNYKGSVLANPFKLKPHGPYEMDECIKLFRHWLWMMFKLAHGEIKRDGSTDYEQLTLVWEKAQRSKLDRNWERAVKLAAEMNRELERLADIADIAETGTLVLICWCVSAGGAGECHARYVARAVEHVIERRKAARSTAIEEPSPETGGNSGTPYDVPTTLLAAAAASARRSPLNRRNC